MGGGDLETSTATKTQNGLLLARLGRLIASATSSCPHNKLQLLFKVRRGGGVANIKNWGQALSSQVSKSLIYVHI